MELARQAESFRTRGLGVAAVVREPVATLKDFATRHKINYPLLADPEFVVIRRFGLVDPRLADPTIAGGQYYGAPYAGTFVVDSTGIIHAKYFQERYEERQTPRSVLALEGEGGVDVREIRTDHFTLHVSSSDAEVILGARFTLILDFEMQDKHHVYAAGAKGYQALALRLDAHPMLTFHETRFPRARPYFFEPLKETIPILDGRFRISQDVTLVVEKALPQLRGSPSSSFAITGSLDYQVCSDRTCYPPATLPMRWTIRTRPAPDVVPRD